MLFVKSFEKTRLLITNSSYDNPIGKEMTENNHFSEWLSQKPPYSGLNITLVCSKVQYAYGKVETRHPRIWGSKWSPCIANPQLKTSVKAIPSVHLPTQCSRHVGFADHLSFSRSMVPIAHTYQLAGTTNTSTHPFCLTNYARSFSGPMCSGGRSQALLRLLAALGNFNL